MLFLFLLLFVVVVAVVVVVVVVCFVLVIVVVVIGAVVVFVFFVVVICVVVDMCICCLHCFVYMVIPGSMLKVLGCIQNSTVRMISVEGQQQGPNRTCGDHTLRQIAIVMQRQFNLENFELVLICKQYPFRSDACVGYFRCRHYIFWYVYNFGLVSFKISRVQYNALIFLKVSISFHAQKRQIFCLQVASIFTTWTTLTSQIHYV